MTYEQALSLAGDQPTWTLRSLIEDGRADGPMLAAARLVIRYRNRCRNRRRTA